MASSQHAKFPVILSGGKSSVVVPRKSQGFLVWGPYQGLDAGKYDVEIEITPLDYERPDEPCCKIDVATNVGVLKILERSLSVQDLLANDNKVRLTFEVKDHGTFEYRIIGVGGAGFRVSYYRKAWPVESRSRSVPLEESPTYIENFPAIDHLAKCGVEFAVESHTLTAKAEGVSLEIHSAEDVQVLQEVFLVKEYNVLPSIRCIAVDIGMNAGVASLALARNPQVEAVFSYEPFAVPFRRAVSNFQRNPGLAAKIRPMNFGLSDRDEELVVKSDPGATIGISVRGAAAGSPERIRIRDAADELGPIIEDALGRGLGVVMKVDCEGSEFAIFESLDRGGLLAKIDAVMIEWHKWWSALKTQADLIAPLRKAGFFVFDRTNPGNPHAGFLLAVRAANGGRPAGDVESAPNPVSLA